MNKSEICKMINNDFSTVKNVYFKINLKAFTDCFSRLTHRKTYYNNIYKELAAIAVYDLDDITKENCEEKLTIGDTLMLAERMIRVSKIYDHNIAGFIIEKVFAEPLAILGKQKNYIQTNSQN